jgi:hypothetical protein
LIEPEGGGGKRGTAVLSSTHPVLILEFVELLLCLCRVPYYRFMLEIFFFEICKNNI